MAIVAVAVTELTPRPKDGNGRFVSPKTAALWAAHCIYCGEGRGDHAVDGTCPDNDCTFEAARTAECLHPTTHVVGCDCALGFC
jgi:hypothetical protein